MNTASPRVHRAIDRVLERCATRVVGRGPAEWRLDLGNGRPLSVLARRDERWLRLVAPVPLDRGVEAPWQTLRLNELLPGELRVVRHPRPIGLALQADLSLEDEERVAVRLESLCRTFRAAAPLLSGKGNAAGPAAPAANKDAEADAALVQLARDGGWQLEQRDPGCISAELDAPGMLSQATLERQHGELRLWIEVLKGGALSEASRNAAGLFLLRLTALLRLVRGAATETPAPAVRLEVCLPAAPSATELDLALAALSLACRLCTRELRGLSDDRLAQTYLDLLPKEE